MTNKKQKENFVPFNFAIKNEDIIERKAFGSFEVIKTDKGIMFKSYTNYHVWTSPYAVDKEGKAVYNSLYRWLDNLLKSKNAVEEGKKLNIGGVSDEDILDFETILTESILLHPLTAFVDVDRASQFALDYMEWLKNKQNELSASMENLTEESSDDVEKFTAEETERIDREEELKEVVENLNDKEK